MMTTEPSERGTLRTILLACGILSSLLYVATDLLGGTSYEGYSFSAQTISELSAIGAPSKPLVGPLFLTYDVHRVKLQEAWYDRYCGPFVDALSALDKSSLICEMFGSASFGDVRVPDQEATIRDGPPCRDGKLGDEPDQPGLPRALVPGHNQRRDLRPVQRLVPI